MYESEQRSSPSGMVLSVICYYFDYRNEMYIIRYLENKLNDYNSSANTSLGNHVVKILHTNLPLHTIFKVDHSPFTPAPFP